jgi:hypothetical protein
MEPSIVHLGEIERELAMSDLRPAIGLAKTQVEVFDLQVWDELDEVVGDAIARSCA